ncbi:MAG: hypothetical protein WAW17_20125 [Rhodococcus sp. (in: high G+C Gram-positive bacteria)]|uniref:hypothetical protein n=1 Tax=Rhodococcus sp. TaxID=1831 RepID=UPI003BAF89D4
MGLARLMLDLPASCTNTDALGWASIELRERRIRARARLALHTTAPTASGVIRCFVFTYWVKGAGGRTPETVAYTHLWARLSRTERTTVLTLTRDGLLTGTVRQILTDTAGHILFLPSSGGEHRLPQTFRLFLHAISAEHR